MRTRFPTLVLAAILAGAMACAGDSGVEPEEQPERVGAEPPYGLVPTSISVAPARFDVGLGGTLQLSTTVRDKTRPRSRYNGPIHYTSSAPEVARVSSDGLVIGIAPGTARVSAAVTSGDSTLASSMEFVVLDSIAQPTLHLRLTPAGWEPSPAYLAAGGTVHWSFVPYFYEDLEPDLKIHMWGGPIDGFAYVNASPGRGERSAERTFEVPGDIEYCLGECWMPPTRGGIIRVR